MSLESSSSLSSKLNLYKEQLSQIDEILALDPTNSDAVKAKNDLLEVIALTTTLHTNALSAENDAKKAKTGVKIVAQFGLGTKVASKWTDGLWYEARVDRIPVFAGDKYLVTFLGYGDQIEVGIEDIASVTMLQQQSQQSNGAAAATTNNNNNNVTGKKHKRDDQSSIPLTTTGDNANAIVDANGNVIPIPKALQILPTDSEDEKKAKRRKIHVIKQQHRAKQMEEDRNKSKSSWQSFASKSGLLQKQSIFRSPDTVTGKVGVTGSGSGLTKQAAFNPTEVKRLAKLAGEDETEENDEE